MLLNHFGKITFLIKGKKMKVAVFSIHAFEKPFLNAANKNFNYQLEYFDARLSSKTAQLAKGFAIVSGFVTDELNSETLKILANNGTQLIALRSAGFNNVDINAAKELGLTVVRVPAYSPYAVAEFAVGLILALKNIAETTLNSIFLFTKDPSTLSDVKIC